jgi:hypothetical protein
MPVSPGAVEAGALEVLEIVVVAGRLSPQPAASGTSAAARNAR